MKTDLTAHLTPETMARAHRELVAKAIAEFTHERLLAPEAHPATGDDDWRLVGQDSHGFDFFGISQQP